MPKRTERWKKLKEEEDYIISNYGRIFSLKTEKFMRPYVHKSRSNNYLRVQLNGKKYMVHVLVAYNFKYQQFEEVSSMFPNENIQVGHDDRNTLNPNDNNLSFETESQNKSHMHATSIVKWRGRTYKGTIESV